MDRDRNIAMGLGSNTFAAATIIRSVESLSLSQIKYSLIRNKEAVIELNGTKIGAFPSHHLSNDMYVLPNDEKYTHTH
jgi:hypothetical protein